ncbi:hypothetical protein BT67DRAFT_184281 [Trichocladium antarcticum]|uniref:Uncharacterized protein n=1 Tax=Trichocladium antarcticum TaxID=1450529 RepID=A0AAN6UPY0_9PEZI|nr:hypothetical protein BT67DRAFT_184281 [Trichocladium antarcticum]
MSPTQRPIPPSRSCLQVIKKAPHRPRPARAPLRPCRARRDASRDYGCGPFSTGGGFPRITQISERRNRGRGDLQSKKKQKTLPPSLSIYRIAVGGRPARRRREPVQVAAPPERASRRIGRACNPEMTPTSGEAGGVRTGCCWVELLNKNGGGLLCCKLSLMRRHSPRLAYTTTAYVLPVAASEWAARRKSTRRRFARWK